MGGLLSALQGTPRPPPTVHDPYRNSFRDTSPPASNFGRETPRSYTQYNTGFANNSRPTTTQSASRNSNLYGFESHANYGQRKVVTSAVSKLPLMPSVYKAPDTVKWNRNGLPHDKSYRLVNVLESERDFLLVSTYFQNGAKGKNLKITKIERVENPFLLGYYLLKKEEMKRRPYKLTEAKYFHGTKKCNIGSICENNFNWRKHGDSTGNRYGKGVSFSPISYYASHYSDKNANDKIMFYVKVLVSNTINGNGNMVLPPKLNGASNVWYDTAIKPGGHVVVKFGDNEFYPEFIIHYCISAPAAQQHRHTTNAYSRNLYYDSDDYGDSDDSDDNYGYY